MTASVEYWLTATYRDSPPAVAALVAQDATPSQVINRLMLEVGKRWTKRFDAAAPRIAAAYVKGAFKASDSAMRMALKDAGFAVKFEMTPAMTDAFEASLAENVGLIRSIPEQYLQQVSGIVNRSYAAGRDLQTMVSELRELYPKAEKRIGFIAFDQSNKASAVVIRTRQMELGITEAIWMHSGAGKHPRPEHVAATGKRYKIAEGFYMKAEGRFVQPGEDPGCRCTSRAVLPQLVA